MVTMTAHLTGLRTHSFLFNPSVLARLAIMSMLPNFGLTVLSFTLDSDPSLAAGGIALVLATMGAGTYLLYRGIEPKWRSSEFGE